MIPRVSIVIDTYNQSSYIEDAVMSVLSQNVPPEQMEILVVDDGSTDDTAERVKKFGACVQYFWKPNGGQASALNFGLKKARGEIIALLDGDDYWFPNKLDSVLAEFEKHPEVGLVYHSLREYYTNTGEFREPAFTPVSGFLPSDIKQVILFDWMFTSSISFRRKILEQLLPIPEGLRIQADGYLCALAMFLAPISAIDRSLGVYRVHGKNLFCQNLGEIDATRLRGRIESSRQMVKGLTDWLSAHGYDARRPEIRTIILRWELLAERDGFLLSPPSRIRFFMHLLKSYRLQCPLMSPRIRAVNYFNAVGALIVGYGSFHVLDETREKISRWVRCESPVRFFFRRKNVLDRQAESGGKHG